MPSPKFSKVLRFSLFFSDILSTYSRIFDLGVQKSDRYLNKNQVSVAIRRYKSLSGKHQSLSSSSPYYNIYRKSCIRTLLSQSAYPFVSILHGHFLCFVAAAPCPPFSVCSVSYRFPVRHSFWLVRDGVGAKLFVGSPKRMRRRSLITKAVSNWRYLSKGMRV